MNPFGAACLAVAVLGGVLVAVRPGLQVGRWMIGCGWWAATLFLLQRFVALDLSLREVVGYSRAELSSGLRAAGMPGCLDPLLAMVNQAHRDPRFRWSGPTTPSAAAGPGR